MNTIINIILALVLTITGANVLEKQQDTALEIKKTIKSSYKNNCQLKLQPALYKSTQQ
tara:strand:+ start:9939 stop:10112 length:174 start_codon:yes stop_codon:yes gene_type:complete